MRIESALYSSRSGIDSHGQAISVVGDNISNANTVGYKGSRVEFADIMSSQAGQDEGSTFVDGSGSGVRVAKVRNIYDDGLIEFTGRGLDVGIAGNGFFLVGDTTDTRYSRAGNFAVTEDGFLTTSDGNNVLGFTGAGTELGALNLFDLATSSTPTTQAQLFGNLDASAATTTVVDNPTTFNEISEAASFIGTLTVYDSLGAPHDLTVGFYKTAANVWTVQSYIGGEDVGGTANTPVKVGNAATMTFSGTGVIEDANAAAALITATPAYANGASAGNFTIDLSSFNQFSAPSQINGVSQDGEGSGQVKSYEVRSNGELYAVLDSGTQVLIGSIALADFVNNDALHRIGSNLFAEGGGAGTRTVGKAGESGLGELQGGALERSNVDISSQFVDLIIYQRGYQASSQTLSAASSLIRDTIQLIR